MTDLILGIETSGFEGSIALRRNGETIDECQLERRRHAQTLIAQVQSLLRNHGLKSNDVTTVAVSYGPGSFTGLRVGVVFAKTFAFAAGCQLVAVDTLEAVVAAAPDDVARVMVIADAQREQLFAGEYQFTEVAPESAGRDIERIGPIDILDHDVFCQRAFTQAAPDFAVSGPGISRVSESLADEVRVLPESLRSPNAAQVASIGERLASSGQFIDPMLFEPFYIRRSSAEDKRDAQSAG